MYINLQNFFLLKFILNIQYPNAPKISLKLKFLWKCMFFIKLLLVWFMKVILSTLAYMQKFSTSVNLDTRLLDTRKTKNNFSTKLNYFYFFVTFRFWYIIFKFMWIYYLYCNSIINCCLKKGHLKVYQAWKTLIRKIFYLTVYKDCVKVMFFYKLQVI